MRSQFDTYQLGSCILAFCLSLYSDESSCLDLFHVSDVTDWLGNVNNVRHFVLYSDDIEADHTAALISQLSRTRYFEYHTAYNYSAYEFGVQLANIQHAMPDLSSLWLTCAAIATLPPLRPGVAAFPNLTAIFLDRCILDAHEMAWLLCGATQYVKADHLVVVIDKVLSLADSRSSEQIASLASTATNWWKSFCQ